MRRLALLCLSTLIASCGDSEPNKRSEAAIAREASIKAEDAALAADIAALDTPIAAFGPSGEAITLGLRRVSNPALLAEIQTTILSAGQDCSQVSAFYDLIQNGSPIAFSEGGRSGGLFKADCSNGTSYQITSMNGRVFVKPWTGRIFGN